jgi:DEAD/DEAH box helicase domain-containing protein
LRLRDGTAFWQGRGSPAPGIGLRSGSVEEYRIVDEDDRLVGTVDAVRAFDSVHPGALYLHLGQQYRVLSLDIDERVALVERADVDEYTQTRRTTEVRILGRDDARHVGRAALSLGSVEVASQVIGFDRRDSRTGEMLARHELSLPPSRLVTRAFWYTVDDDVLDAARLEPGQVPGTLHAVEHAGIGILPLFTICDRWDVGGVSMPWCPDTNRPTIFVYDGYPGGVGIAELGFGAGDRHLAATLAVVERCPCGRGCPGCVQSPKCGNGNDPLDKAGAVALLRAVLTTNPRPASRPGR